MGTERQHSEIAAKALKSSDYLTKRASGKDSDLHNDNSPKLLNCSFLSVGKIDHHLDAEIELQRLPAFV